MVGLDWIELFSGPPAVTDYNLVRGPPAVTDYNLVRGPLAVTDYNLVRGPRARKLRSLLVLLLSLK